MKALDLFCKAGGASMGLHQAGFEVTGIDIEAQKRYPFTFFQGDVLQIDIEWCRQFDLIWASPPCQAHSALKVLHNAKNHLDLIPATRSLLKMIGKPYVIENVVGAPLINPIQLCGTMFGLGVKDADLRRHRIFETSFSVLQQHCNHGARATIGVYGGHIRNRKRTIAPTGHDLVANSTIRRLNREAGYPDFTIADGYEAMGINWMVRDELSQAIPPAYSKYLAEQFVIFTNTALDKNYEQFRNDQKELFMAPRTRRTVSQPAEQAPPPAAGHNSEFTDDALIAENFRLEDELKAANAKLNEWAAPRKVRMKEIEDELFARLSTRGADSTKTDSGTAYKSTVGSVKIENREALFDFVADNWEKYGSEMLQLGAAIGPVRAYMDDNDGRLPPGVNLTNFIRLNIKRS